MIYHKQSSPIFPTKKRNFRGNINYDIINVSNALNINIADVMVRSSEHSAVIKRTRIIFEIKKLGYSYTDIGRAFNLTPQAILYSVKKKLK